MKKYDGKLRWKISMKIFDEKFETVQTESEDSLREKLTNMINKTYNTDAFWEHVDDFISDETPHAYLNRDWDFSEIHNEADKFENNNSRRTSPFPSSARRTPTNKRKRQQTTSEQQTRSTNEHGSHVYDVEYAKYAKHRAYVGPAAVYNGVNTPNANEQSDISEEATASDEPSTLSEGATASEGDKGNISTQLHKS